MNPVNLKFRRFEFKYHLPRSIADRIIPEIMNYMVWDEYAGKRGYYEVHSIYMDSENFDSYYEKIDGIMNRKKSRIRSYKRTWNKDSDLFFELKRKSGDVILKDRIVVKGADAEKFLEDPFSLHRIKKYDEKFLNEFLYEYSIKRQSPKVLVSYKRRPFFSKYDKRFRLTFDYDIELSRVNDLNFNKDCEKVFDDLVTLEVKFNAKMPRWFHNVIEAYGLQKITFSKYCYAVDGANGFPNYY